MTGKRKRNRPGQGKGGDSKRQKTTTSCNWNVSGKQPLVQHAVLAQYYPQVLSLREYLLSKLPPTSKTRRKKISSVGKKARPNAQNDEVFATFLDRTLIGVRSNKDVPQQERLQQWTSFTQHVDTSDSGFANLSGVGIYSQSEVRTYGDSIFFLMY
jgi:hypothetical protein